jgi:hypothetical protein
MNDLSRLLKLQAAMPGEPEVDHPRPERLLQGNPRRETWNEVDGPLAAGSRLYCGVWHCQPGRWRIAFGPHEHELFTVLHGRCRVHAADGGWREAGPGEALYIAPGFQGEFEVIEPMAKTYAIVDAGGDAA